MSPSLTGGPPVVHGADEFGADLLQLGSGHLDVVHNEASDGTGGEVPVSGIAGPEDLHPGAVREAEDGEIRLRVIEGEPQPVPIERHHLLVRLGADAQPSDALYLHQQFPS